MIMKLRVLVLLGLCMSASALFGASKDEVKVMSFNIRYENTSDGEFVWPNRRDAVVKMIQKEQPAVAGLQEVMKSQFNFLKDNLTNYEAVGVGRLDGKEAGEYSPIFYNTQRVKLLKSGHFWLSETPEVPSLGWDAACERIATWCVFESIDNKEQFICINTHFDHVGEKAREKSCQMMLDTVATLAAGLPVVMTGDFNTTLDHPSLAPMTKALKEVRSTNAKFDAQPKYTFTGFNQKDNYTLIDYIFVRDFKPTDYRVVMDTYGVKQLSDHLPIVSVLRF